MTGEIDVTRTAHGPFERLSFRPTDPPLGAQVSVYRVGDTLIDTASTRVTRAVLDELRARPPRRILLTHQHEDHIGNVAPILAITGAIPVLAPRAHLGAIASLREVPPYRAAYWGHPHPVAAELLTPFDPGDAFHEPGVTLVAVATPGHTPGHVAFVADTGNDVWALTGDLYTSRPLEAFYESAADDAVASLRALARTGPRLRMLPTHGRARDDGAATLAAGADAIEREAARVVDTAARLGTRDPVEVARAVWGDDPMLEFSSGEMGHSIFARSVLSPARSLPVAPIRPGGSA